MVVKKATSAPGSDVEIPARVATFDVYNILHFFAKYLENVSS